jgi:DNA replication and repair protein RecF
MFLNKIILTNFKNYEQENFTFSPQINGIVGLNGVGKTNLLDAIYYLCLTKSRFFALDPDVMLKGQDFFRVEGVFTKEGKTEKIVAKVQPRKKKVFERGDVPYKSLSQHVGQFPVVMITPDDTDLAREGSETRRRFMDITLSQCNQTYLHSLMDYNKILEQRNAILRGLDYMYTAEDSIPLLDIYEEQMEEPALAIYQTRRIFVQNFATVFADLYKRISGDRENVTCVYDSQLHFQDFAKLIRSNRAKDLVLKRTVTGIHKDDLLFTMDDKSVKRFGSQGQLKSFVLSLKLAQYELLKDIKKVEPILLLDDIFDKLDENRVRNLLELLIERGFGQIFITDTDEKRLESIVKTLNTDFKKITIDNGKILN